MAEGPFHLDLTAVFEPAAEGGYTASFAEMPEVFSEGETLEEAKANLLDALQLVMEYNRDQSQQQGATSADTVRETVHLTAAP